MIRNEKFHINKMGEDYILICEDKSIFQGMIRLSPSGRFIWDLLENNISYEELVNKATEKYDVDLDVVKNDIDNFLDSLKKVNGIYDVR